jgi:hypothetical protein
LCPPPQMTVTTGVQLEINFLCSHRAQSWSYPLLCCSPCVPQPAARRQSVPPPLWTRTPLCYHATSPRFVAPPKEGGVGVKQRVRSGREVRVISRGGFPYPSAVIPTGFNHRCGGVGSCRKRGRQSIGGVRGSELYSPQAKSLSSPHFPTGKSRSL